jgi:transposase
MAKQLPRPDLSKLSETDKDKLIVALLDLNDTLSAQVAKLVARVEALEAQVRKNSNNSSKPPSSDGLAKKKTSSLRQPSGKAPGGQKGRAGSTLRQTDRPTDTVTHPLPSHCAHCSEPLPVGDAEVWCRRQVVDVPTVAFKVLEHRTLALTCRCGRRHTSEFPAGVTEAVQYGPNVRALGVHLTQGQMLPYARAAELIADVYGLTVSPGTLVAWVGEARNALQGTADTIAAQLRTAALAHADESGLRVEGKLHWLHVVSNPSHTWYGVHEKRGMAAIEAHGILATRTGVLVHDCLASYWRLDGSVHALCNAHLLRELLYVKETTGQSWAQDMSDFLLNANKLCAAGREKQIVFTPDQVQAFRTVYDGIVREGELLNPEVPATKAGRAKQSIATNLLRRFRDHADAVLRFIGDFSVPFTNNEAERAVRMPKVKQKISGCFRSREGAEHFCVIRSCLDTLRKQGHSMLAVLLRAFTGDPIQPAA